MKKILTKLLAVSGVGLLLLTACKKDGNLATATGGKAGTLTASATTLPLNKAQINDTTTVINFSFTKANYGYSAAVTSTLQIDVPGDNWKNPTSQTLTAGAYSQGFNTATFNNLVLKLNVPAGVATPIVARVQQSISGQIAPIYSNTLSLNVTAFNLTSWVYVPGAYEGWSNPGPQMDSLVSVTGNGIYIGIINFPAGGSQFLVLPSNGTTAGLQVGKGSWNYKYATTDNPGTGTTATFSTEYVASGGNNFQAPSAGGYYLVTLNINSNQLTIVPADYYSVIGDAAQGWGTDVPMKYINDGNGNWTITTALVSTGTFKVRQDDAWGNSWGIPKAGTAGDGTANTLNDTQNNNIPVAASGNYTMTFNMPATPFGASSYTNPPTYNNAAFPFVTTTYTLTKD